MNYEPNSTLHLLSNVPISDYINQLDFDSEMEQTSYFMSKAVFTDTDYTYLRKYSSIRVKYPADSLYNVCYAMFRNTNYGGKWFYAFVRDVVYYNNEMSDIILELDEWQTWQFRIKIQPSFVEREHVANDTFGLHLLDEGLATGDYTTNQFQFIDFSECWIAVNTTVSFQGEDFIPANGSIIDGVYSGTQTYVFDSSQSLGLTLYYLADQGRSDAVVGMYMLPKELAPNLSDGDYLHDYGRQYDNNLKVYNIPQLNTVDGYVPKNNKLLTYPYRVCVLSATTGGATKIRYEFMNTPQVAVQGNKTAAGSAIMYPLNYKNVYKNVGEGVQLESHQQCQWIQDTFMNWMATQGIKNQYQYENAELYSLKSGMDQQINNLAGLAKNPLTRGWSSAVESVKDYSQMELDIWFNQAMVERSINMEREIFSMIPPAARGTVSGSPLIAADKYGFMIENRSITRQQAQVIDSYFEMYGYRVSLLKDIDYKSRPFWNYVRTSGVIITGCIPRRSLDVIKNMFNNGVTMWHDDDLGNYNRNNHTGAPTTQVQLTVENGSGTGIYYSNDSVVITANNPPEGQLFKTWVITQGQANVVAPNRSQTSIVLSNVDVTVAATYSENPGTLFGLAVINGTGGGSYTAGTEVTITAKEIEGNVFERWIPFTGNPTITDPTSPTTTVIMPAENCSVEGTYTTPVEPTYTTIADAMQADEGAMEWDATVGKIQRWYYGDYVKDAWCATSVSYYAFQVGATDVKKNENVDTMWGAMRTSKWRTPQYGGTTRKPKKGDLVFFSRVHAFEDLTHVGVVVEPGNEDATSFSYVSGNTPRPGTNKDDGIWTKTISYSDMYVVCFAEVNY